jgi:uncharacterized protein (TIGR03382 family)
VEPQPAYSALPEDSDGPPDDVELDQAQGCGASASGGMPLVAAVGLLGMALLTRRRHALARAHSRSRR